MARFMALTVGKQTMVCAASGSRCSEEINNYFLLIEYARSPASVNLHGASSLVREVRAFLWQTDRARSPNMCIRLNGREIKLHHALIFSSLHQFQNSGLIMQITYYAHTAYAVYKKCQQRYDHFISS